MFKYAILGKVHIDRVPLNSTHKGKLALPLQLGIKGKMALLKLKCFDSSQSHLFFFDNLKTEPKNIVLHINSLSKSKIMSYGYCC